MSSEKSQLRQLIRNRKRQFTRQQLGELSLTLCETLRQRLPEAPAIIAYWPLPDEPDIRPLLLEWTGEGRVVLLPCVVSDTEMELRRFTGVADLREGAFHIMEPISLAPHRSLLTPHLPALIPGVAFDAAGHRLGRGRGYYDRFLVQHSYIYKIGVGYPFQLVERVPSEAYDILMDEVAGCL